LWNLSQAPGGADTYDGSMRLALPIAIVAVCGCADNPVLDLGDGRHSVVDSSLRGAPYARGGALEAANAYCAQRSQKAVVERFDDNRVPDDLATSSVVFRCR
jgi:hypothetical protein